MNKTITISAVVLIILLGFGGKYLLSSQSSANQKKGKAPTTKTQLKISTQKVLNENVEQIVEISGRVQAFNKIEVYSEVTGVFKPSNKVFREGAYFSKGQNLVKIDDEVYRNNMLAEKSSLLNQLTQLIPDLMIDYPNSVSKWESFLNEFDLEKPLKPLPSPNSSRERNYIAANNIYTKYYAVKSMEAELDKYTIKAPFNGVVTESSVNPGALVRQNQKIGEFTSTSIYELNAIAKLEDLKFLKVGQKVSLHSEDIDEDFSGTVQRINQKITPETQSVNVFIRTSNPKLKDGMYVTAKVKQNIENAFKVRRSLLINKQNLYVLRDSVVSLRKVQVVGAYDDMAIVKGLPDGAMLITEKFDGIKDGFDLRSLFSDKEQPGKNNLSSLNQ